MRGAAMAALLLAASCSPDPGPPAPDRLPVTPGPRGLDVGDTGLEIGFGRTESGTIDAVAFLLGGPPDARGTAPGCPGARLARWDAAGLTLYFTDADFVGWRRGAARAGETCS